MMTAPLLPAEAALLIEPYPFSAGKCIQAALLTLLGRDHIAIQDKTGWFSQRSLRLLDGDGQPLPPHLAVLKNALKSERGSVLKPNEVVRALQKWFGSNYRNYVHDHLARELIARGLLEREDRRFLGLIPYVRYQRTASGEAKAAPLLQLIDEAGNMRRLIRRDPDRAIQLARAAGVLLVLSPAARSQVPKLKSLFEQQGDGGTAAVTYTDSDDGGAGASEWEVGVEIGDFSSAFDTMGAFDGIAAVGDFTGGDGGDGDGDGGGGGD